MVEVTQLVGGRTGATSSLALTLCAYPDDTRAQLHQRTLAIWPP